MGRQCSRGHGDCEVPGATPTLRRQALHLEEVREQLGKALVFRVNGGGAMRRSRTTARCGSSQVRNLGFRSEGEEPRGGEERWIEAVQVREHQAARPARPTAAAGLASNGRSRAATAAATASP